MTVINVEFKCQPVGRISAIRVMDELLEEKGNAKITIFRFYLWYVWTDLHKILPAYFLVLNKCTLIVELHFNSATSHQSLA